MNLDSDFRVIQGSDLPEPTEVQKKSAQTQSILFAVLLAVTIGACAAEFILFALHGAQGVRW